MSATLDNTQALRFSGEAATAADDLVQRLEQLNAIGASLSAERDINRLLGLKSPHLVTPPELLGETEI